MALLNLQVHHLLLMIDDVLLNKPLKSQDKLLMHD
jgi:hypothetical protein